MRKVVILEKSMLISIQHKDDQHHTNYLRREHTTGVEWKIWKSGWVKFYYVEPFEHFYKMDFEGEIPEKPELTRRNSETEPVEEIKQFNAAVRLASTLTYVKDRTVFVDESRQIWMAGMWGGELWLFKLKDWDKVGGTFVSERKLGPGVHFYPDIRIEKIPDADASLNVHEKV